MPDDLVARNPFRDGYILIDELVVRRIRRHRQLGLRAFEAGGLLLGFRRGTHLDVTIATTPKARDKRDRTSFHRVSHFHQRFATRAWKRFGGRIDYLGEWHTHPQPFPSPSLVDYSEWKTLSRKQSNEMVFLILGTKSLWLGVGIRGDIVRVDHPISR